MIEAGLQLMLIGMSVVFVFLVLLVALMTVMSAITRRFETPVPAAGTSDAPTPSSPGGSSPHQHSPQIAAVLAAVAQHHRRRVGDTARTTNTTSGAHR